MSNRDFQPAACPRVACDVLKFGASTRPLTCALLLMSLAFVARHSSFAQDSPEVIRQKVEAEYPLTKTTASKDDIVTAGAVLILEKDNLEMSTVSSQTQAQNTYKGGKISHSAMTGIMKFNRKLPGHSDAAGSTRTFVAGEKFWLTKVEVKDDGVVLTLFSDPIADVRYTSLLKIPYTKGAPQAASAILATVAEVVKVQPSDDAKATNDTPAAPPPATAAPAQSYAAIPPPPPPADAPPTQPKTLAIGQSKDQLVAMFGAPTRILDKGAIKIYVYPDMKVTLKADKVSDFQ
jgi:hypothetical protein